MTNLSGQLKGTKKHYIGINDWKKVYLSAPSWDCGWYWGFGYLWNKDCHYHLDWLTKIQTYNSEKQVFEYEFLNLKDWIVKHFTDLQIKEGSIWTFTELMNTAYKLKEVVWILAKWSSNYTDNPLWELIRNNDESVRINEEVLPAIFLEIEKCFLTPEDSEKIKKLKARKIKLEKQLKENEEEAKEIQNSKYKEIREIEKDILKV